MPHPTPRAALEALLATPLALQPAAISRIVDWARHVPITAERAPVDLMAMDGPHDGLQRMGGVAIVPVYGMIEQRSSWLMEYFGGCSVDGIRESLAAAMADATVTAIVLDIDSPGGTVAGVTELAGELRAARGGTKPIVAVCDTLMASAAAWIGLQADEVVITPSGHAGSIGVYAIHQDISRMMDEMGVTTTFISAGEHKTEGNEFEPLSDAARADIQARVNATYATMLADSAAGRRVSVATVEADYGGGRVLTARDALAVGMVDRIESLGQTIQRLGKPAGRRRAISAEANVPDLAAAGSPVIIEAQAEGLLADDEGSPSGDAAPFTERVTSLATEAYAIVGHARERARLRAKSGRPAFSTTTETSLRSIRDAIDGLLSLDEPGEDDPPEEPVEPAPEVNAPPTAAVPTPVRFRSRSDWLHYLEAHAR